MSSVLIYTDCPKCNASLEIEGELYDKGSCTTCGAPYVIGFDGDYDEDSVVIADFDVEGYPEFKIEKNTKLCWDRTRTVNYNGAETLMNSYSCSTCGGHYKFEEIPHSWCPFCGTKYEHTEDVSA